VGYENIHYPNQETDGITDPYSMDFRDPLWPEWLVNASHASIRNADWAVVYKTWWDGEWWAACRRLPDESIRCQLLEGTSVPPRLAERSSLIPAPSP
jgi:hypothetical protein